MSLLQKLSITIIERTIPSQMMVRGNEECGSKSLSFLCTIKHKFEDSLSFELELEVEELPSSSS